MPCNWTGWSLLSILVPSLIKAINAPRALWVKCWLNLPWGLLGPVTWPFLIAASWNCIHSTNHSSWASTRRLLINFIVLRIRFHFQLKVYETLHPHLVCSLASCLSIPHSLYMSVIQWTLNSVHTVRMSNHILATHNRGDSCIHTTNRLV